MYAIIKKELRSYYRSAATYAFFILLLLFGGFYFSKHLFSPANYTLAHLFSDISVLFPLLIPILTMRSFAIERHYETDKILFTGRASMFSIVLAKFFSIASIFLLGMSLVFCYPILLYILGGAHMGALLLMYLGLCLFGCVIIAFGIFLSSMSSHPLRAGIVTIAGIMAFWMLATVLSNIENTALRELLAMFSVYSELGSFQYGLLQASSVLYMLSYTFALLLLTAQTMHIWRATKYGSA